MPVSYYKYLEIKDKYCLAYFGVFNEFILQLVYLHPILEEKHPGLDLYISCKDELIKKYDLKHQKIIPQTTLNIKNFAYFRELKFDNLNHPVEQLLKESNLKIVLPKLKYSKPENCHITCRNLPPAKSLDQPVINKIKAFLTSEGVHIAENYSENVDWVIGIDNDVFYHAANKGIKVSLVDSSFNSKFLENIYPNLEILNITSI